MFFRLFNLHNDVEEAYSQIMKNLHQILKGEKAIMDKFDVLEAAVAEAVRVNNEALEKINESVATLAEQVVQINDLVSQLGEAADDPEQIAALVAELSASTEALKTAVEDVVVPPPVEVPPTPVDPDAHPDHTLPTPETPVDPGWTGGVAPPGQEGGAPQVNPLKK